MLFVSLGIDVRSGDRTAMLERPNANGQVDLVRNTKTGNLHAQILLTVDGRRSAYLPIEILQFYEYICILVTKFASRYFVMLITLPSGEQDLFIHSHTLGTTIKLKVRFLFVIACHFPIYVSSCCRCSLSFASRQRRARAWLATLCVRP